MARSEELSGVQKAAVLLIALGPDKSANVFKHLKEDEIEQLHLCKFDRLNLFERQMPANYLTLFRMSIHRQLHSFYPICLPDRHLQLFLHCRRISRRM